MQRCTIALKRFGENQYPNLRSMMQIYMYCFTCIRLCFYIPFKKKRSLPKCPKTQTACAETLPSW
jgi:hypothetical protein